MCPGLGLEHSQQLELTPEVREGIEIMAMPIMELRSLVLNKAMGNPFLRFDETFQSHSDTSPQAPKEEGSAEKELEDEGSFQQGVDPGAWDGSWGASVSESDGFFASDPFDDLSRTPDDGSSLESAMLDQLKLELRSKTDIAIAEHLLEGIDDAGYLRADTDIIADILQVDPDRVESVLEVMRTECVPAGIGARSLQERLLSQLHSENLDDDLTRIIVENHLDELASGNFSKIAKRLGVSSGEVKDSLEKIRKLDPHPTSAFDRATPISYPEVMVIGEPGSWSVKMRKGLLPKIVIDEDYEGLLNDTKSPLEGAEKMQSLLREANGFIRAIDMRRTSIYSIARAIVEAQSDFFDQGVSGLHPLTMVEVASITGLSESTVSRVANSVTMDTPRGIIGMRYFFHSKVGANLISDGTSSFAVKQAIKDLVDAEDPHHPLSDTKIVELLSEKGMDVSRRTVNKYRTALGILSSSKRRVYD